MFADGNLCYALVLVILDPLSSSCRLNMPFTLILLLAWCFYLSVLCAYAVLAHIMVTIFFQNIDSNIDVLSLHWVKSLGEIVWNFDKLQVEILTRVAAP